ncbi:hypothetical protein KIL84_012822 [Mauremys mutica]|uniref:Uncharacterized protein n=1 Tax=Mauremys mutica TaxID=74926 RepID=A0A9D3XSV0_9SAUR|nr:hypothetical protein KIL84_012822 [Mauremys mutica]
MAQTTLLQAGSQNLWTKPGGVCSTTLGPKLGCYGTVPPVTDPNTVPLGQNIAYSTSKTSSERRWILSQTSPQRTSPLQPICHSPCPAIWTTNSMLPAVLLPCQ